MDESTRIGLLCKVNAFEGRSQVEDVVPTVSSPIDAVTDVDLGAVSQKREYGRSRSEETYAARITRVSGRQSAIACNHLDGVDLDRKRGDGGEGGEDRNEPKEGS